MPEAGLMFELIINRTCATEKPLQTRVHACNAHNIKCCARQNRHSERERERERAKESSLTGENKSKNKLRIMPFVLPSSHFGKTI